MSLHFINLYINVQYIGKHRQFYPRKINKNMNDIIPLLIQYRTMLISSTLLIILTVYSYYNREGLRLWLKSLLFRLPLIGRNQGLSKNLGLDDQNWFNSEREACNAFIKDYIKHGVDEEHYQQSSIYLDKVGDKGVSPLTWYHWIGLFVLVTIEAAGFAYVLADFTLQDASETLQKEAAIAIAVLISALLVVLTHAMGAELYRNQQIDKVRLRWKNSTSKSNIIEPNNLVSLQSKKNHIDDDDPGWQQMANRLNKVNAQFVKSWTMTSITLVFVAIVAIGATYVRGQALEKLSIEITQGESSESIITFENPFESAPQAVKDNNTAADKQAQNEKMEAHKKAGWTTFIILAVIFLAMQFYSIYLGFKKTFSGKESQLAYQTVHKFDNINSYIAFHKEKQEAVTRTAQQVLSHLQAKTAMYAQHNSGEQKVLTAAANPTSRNFINFLKLEMLRHTQEVELIRQPQQITPTPKVHQKTHTQQKSTDLTDEILDKVKRGDIDDLDDATIVRAMKEMKAQQNKPKETSAERMARLEECIES